MIYHKNYERFKILSFYFIDHYLINVLYLRLFYLVKINQNISSYFILQILIHFLFHQYTLISLMHQTFMNLLDPLLKLRYQCLLDVSFIDFYSIYLELFDITSLKYFYS